MDPGVVIIYYSERYPQRNPNNRSLHMAGDSKKLSASESLLKTRTFGKVRCHNPSCMDRLTPSPGSKEIACPACGMTYRLFWVTPELPRIRGPVWEVNRKLAEETIARKIGSSTDDSQ